MKPQTTMPAPGLTAQLTGLANTAPLFKTCRECGRTLPIDAFGKSAQSPDGHMHLCRECLKPILDANRAKMKVHTRPGVKKTLSLNDFTDAQLAAELNRRGYTGNISKTSTLAI